MMPQRNVGPTIVLACVVCIVHGRIANPVHSLAGSAAMSGTAVAIFFVVLIGRRTVEGVRRRSVGSVAV